jgi:hypothetical protein
MRSHIHASPPALETYGVYVPAGIERAIMKALAKRTSERFGTCSEMEAALWNAMHAAGWRRPATPAMTLPQWSTGSAAGAALTGPAGAGLPETVLAGQGGSVSATTASRSLLDRLTWKHYAAAAVVALALGGGAMLAFHSFFPGSAARGSNAGQNAQPAVQSATTPPASSGPAAANSNASGNPATEPGAKAQIPPAQVAAPAASSQPAALAPGVYVLQDGKWAELLEESVNWKKGSPLRRLTLGLGKGEFVGSIPGAASPNGYRVPVTFRISTAEGFTADNYALVLLEAKGALREVRVGGSGASARSVRFTAKPVDTRVWELQFSQGAGEYGFLPPVREGDLPIAPRMYTFRVIP